MAKLINKNKCKFENGYIIHKHKIIGVPVVVGMQMRKLELMFQQWRYLKQQPGYTPAPSLDGFEFKSGLHDVDWHVERPSTPAMDARLEESMQFIADVDKVDDYHKINEMIDQFEALIRWCEADKFVPGDDLAPIDAPCCIVNPLTLDPRDVVSVIEMMVYDPAIDINVKEPCVVSDGSSPYCKVIL